jgi:long-chain acyl-CoA synthetase
MDARSWHEFYETTVPPSLDYIDTPVQQLLERSAKRFPDRTALIFRNNRITYAELHNSTERFATALSRLGVTRGGRVAIYLPNLPQTVIAYFATLRLGAIAVMTNPLYTSREIEHQWNDAGVTVVVALDALYRGRIEPIRKRLHVQHYIVASIPEYLRFPLNLLAPFKLKKMQPPMIAEVTPGANVHPFRDLLRRTSPSPPNVVVRMDEVAMLQYTGGTTGVSKGAILTHRNITANVQQMRTWNTALREGEDVMIACLPLFHIYGLTVVMLLGIDAAACLVLIPNPRDIDAIVRGIVKYRATMCPAVPAMFAGINEFPEIEKLDLSSIKVCNSGSAPLPVEVLEKFERLTGAKISEGYGLTEASPVTHSNPFFGKRKVGSIGIPLPDTDTRIVDLEDGQTDRSIGEDGELLISGPQVFGGYWNRPDETEQVLTDGWLRTGDIARMDDEGYTYIVGRKKDMILASGYNVYPDEIDRVLMAHPDILEAATIGVPDVKRGETVKSFVVLRPGVAASADQIVSYCKENLAAYKVPRSIEFRDSLPRSTVLKVLRRELRDEELKKRESASEAGVAKTAG